MLSFDDPKNGAIDERQKEACAIVAMRAMLEDYATMRGIPFQEALLSFARTRLYDALFDYPTRLWAEGPAYLADTWKREVDQL